MKNAPDLSPNIQVIDRIIEQIARLTHVPAHYLAADHDTPQG